jgi:UDP-N-acetylmuramoyl-tripeptide--D-alanyl-D-alanine ligase
MDQALWLGITGSVGKSTVKEMLAEILARGAGWNVHRAPRSFNNAIGVPATILGALPAHRAAVLELGTSQHGEIERLTRVARPNIAVITGAAPCHLEGLGTVRGVAEEKAHILDLQHPEDAAILNFDDRYFEMWRSQAKGTVLSFGFGEGAQVRGELPPDDVSSSHSGSYLRPHSLSGAAFGPLNCASFQLNLGRRRASVRLSVPGPHNVLNALAAAAAAQAAGVELEAIVTGLQSFKGVSRRLQISQLDGVTYLDDAYNANPQSYRAALRVLQNFKAAGYRTFVVAGDMLELGAKAEEHHLELGRWLAAVAPHELITVGRWAALAGNSAVHSGLPMRAWMGCSSPDEAADRLISQLRSGDVVLVKGSNGIHLDRCIAKLTERSAAAAGG